MSINAEHRRDKRELNGRKRIRVNHSFFPRFAGKYGPMFATAGNIGILVLLALASVKLFSLMLLMKPWSYLVAITASVTALAIGHWFASSDPNDRTDLAVESGVRHPALALTIGVTNLTPENALPVLVPCVLVFMLIGIVYLLWRKRVRLPEKPWGRMRRRGADLVTV